MSHSDDLTHASIASSAEALSTLKVNRSRGNSLIETSQHQDFAGCPNPEPNKDNYTDNRLTQSLSYAESFLQRRDISPRAELFMTIFKDDVKAALCAVDKDERAELANCVMVEERLIREKHFLKPLDKTAGKQQIESNLLDLRKLQYWVRYGDYLKVLPGQLREVSGKKETINAGLLSSRHKWSEIGKKLQEELDAQKIAAANPKSDRPIAEHTIAVRLACRELGLDEDLAEWSIMEYGRRNEQVHLDFDILIRDGEFPKLAKTMHADRQELRCVFSVVKTEVDLAHLEGLIEIQINKWFESQYTHKAPQWWSATKTLRELSEVLQKKEAAPGKAALKAAKDAAIKAQQEEKAARQKAAQEAGALAVAAGKKRVASTAEPRDSETSRKPAKRTKWRIEALAKQCKLEEELRAIDEELLREDTEGDELEDSDEALEGLQMFE